MNIVKIYYLLSLHMIYDSHICDFREIENDHLLHYVKTPAVFLSEHLVLQFLVKIVVCFVTFSNLHKEMLYTDT